MTNISVRKATFSDVEKLTELRLLLQQHCEESNSQIWQMTDEGKALLKQKVQNDFVNESSRIFIAETNGNIVGFAHGDVSHRTDYLPKNVGNISTVYVNSNFRRKGIGALLIRHICEFFDSEGVEDVTLRYIIGNKEAERFWGKLGFKPVITTAKIDLKDLEREMSKASTPHTQTEL
jgi:ribosomal protein S18 acetylase RimI-like enzyme